MHNNMPQGPTHAGVSITHDGLPTLSAVHCFDQGNIATFNVQTVRIPQNSTTPVDPNKLSLQQHGMYTKPPFDPRSNYQPSPAVYPNGNPTVNCQNMNMKQAAVPNNPTFPGVTGIPPLNYETASQFVQIAPKPYGTNIHNNTMLDDAIRTFTMQFPLDPNNTSISPQIPNPSCNQMNPLSGTPLSGMRDLVSSIDKFPEFPPQCKAGVPPFGNVGLGTQASPFNVAAGNPFPYVTLRPQAFLHQYETLNVHHQSVAKLKHLPYAHNNNSRMNIPSNPFQGNEVHTNTEKIPIGHCVCCRKGVRSDGRVVAYQVMCSDCEKGNTFQNMNMNHLKNNNIQSNNNNCFPYQNTQHILMGSNFSSKNVGDINHQAFEKKQNEAELGSDLRLIGDLPPPLAPISAVPSSSCDKMLQADIVTSRGGDKDTGTGVCQCSENQVNPTSNSTSCLTCGKLRQRNVQPILQDCCVDQKTVKIGTSNNLKTSMKGNIEEIDLTETPPNEIDVGSSASKMKNMFTAFDDDAFQAFINDSSSNTCNDDNTCGSKVEFNRKRKSPSLNVSVENDSGIRIQQKTGDAKLNPPAPKINIDKDALERLRNKVTPILKSKKWLKENRLNSQTEESSQNFDS